MRVIGMEIHRTFAEAVMIDGDKLIRLGRVTMPRDHLAAFAGRLTHEDHIVVEATGNAQLWPRLSHLLSAAWSSPIRSKCISLPKRESKRTSSTRPCSLVCTPADSCLRCGCQTSRP